MSDSENSENIRDHFRSIRQRRLENNFTSGSNMESDNQSAEMQVDIDDDDNEQEVNDQPVILEDPNIPYGETVIAEENDQVKVTFSRVKFRRNLKFHLTDFQYSMKVEFKEESEDLLLKDAIPTILAGLEKVIDQVKTTFEPFLNRNMYITLAQNGLTPGIRVGVTNLQNDSTKEIVKKTQEKIYAVLESHQNLAVDTSLNIYLGSIHK